MKIVTAAEMREIDRITSEKYGVPSLTLMENAGAAVAEFIQREYTKATSFGVICGKGNNGGDGFVCARKLHEAGKSVSVLLLADPSELKGDAATMFKKLPVQPVTARTEDELKSAAAQQVYEADLLVDAILGTGFKPPVTGVYARAIKRLKIKKRTLISVDIPSGVDADRSEPPTCDERLLSPDAVVTFTAPKPAHVFAGLCRHRGGVLVAPIGSPAEAVTSASGLELITSRDPSGAWSKNRDPEAHKGFFGHVLVVGGSVGKAGAAAMAGLAALRAGAGLVTVACPRSVLPTVASFAPELMTEPLEETEAGTISTRCLEYRRFEKLLEGKDVLALGPGLSRHPESAEFARVVVQRFDLPTVIDADGLNAFQGHTSLLARLVPPNRERSFAAPLVLTPHPGEMGRLAGGGRFLLNAERIKQARAFAAERELILVLKGHRTLVAGPNESVWVNATGNPGMATGGTGDVLTGLIAAFLGKATWGPAIGLPPEKYYGAQFASDRTRGHQVLSTHFEVPPGEVDRLLEVINPMYAGIVQDNILEALRCYCAAVHLHGLAGDIARDHLGEESLIATDLLKYLPDAFRRLREQARDRFVRIA